MRNTQLPDKTLIISGWSSRCNNCGYDADPDEKAHITRLGWDPGDGKGCGVEWTHVFSNYTGSAEDRVRKMRPDLTFIPNDRV